LLATGFYANNEADRILDEVIQDLLLILDDPQHQAMAQLECQNWREVYRTMGLKASKILCSFESLYKRVNKSRTFPRINPLVDIYNAICIKHGLCLGAYDVKHLVGEVSIRFAQAGERLMPIGASESLELTPATVIYADQAGPVCAFWNHRDADRSKVTPDTLDLVIYIDDLNYAAGRAQNAMNELEALLQKIANPGLQMTRIPVAV
jgi:DNA/RNA-binding domain of Phe-tRNA-synthetase-like protein